TQEAEAVGGGRGAYRKKENGQRVQFGAEATASTLPLRQIDQKPEDAHPVISQAVVRRAGADGQGCQDGVIFSSHAMLKVLRRDPRSNPVAWAAIIPFGRSSSLFLPV
ncbi:hypothetical protein THAOC_08210, partial [Thalassiosira oceanica]